MGGESVYANCIFVDNNLNDGLKGTERYELDLQAGAKLSGCLIHGIVRDPRNSVSPGENVLNAPAPRFNQYFVPDSPEFKNAGYRPVPTETASAVHSP